MKKYTKLVSFITLVFYSILFSYVGNACSLATYAQPYYVTDRLEYVAEHNEYVLYFRLYNSSDRSLFFTARTLLGKNSDIEWFGSDGIAMSLRSVITVGQPRGKIEIEPHSYIERSLTLMHRYPDLAAMLQKQSLQFHWVANINFQSGEEGCGVGVGIPRCQWENYIAKGSRFIPNGQGASQAEERAEIITAPKRWR